MIKPIQTEVENIFTKTFNNQYHIWPQYYFTFYFRELSLIAAIDDDRVYEYDWYQNISIADKNSNYSTLPTINLVDKLFRDQIVYDCNLVAAKIKNIYLDTQDQFAANLDIWNEHRTITLDLKAFQELRVFKPELPKIEKFTLEEWIRHAARETELDAANVKKKIRTPKVPKKFTLADWIK